MSLETKLTEALNGFDNKIYLNPAENNGVKITAKLDSEAINIKDYAKNIADKIYDNCTSSTGSLLGYLGFDSNNYNGVPVNSATEYKLSANIKYGGIFDGLFRSANYRKLEVSIDKQTGEITINVSGADKNSVLRTAYDALDKLTTYARILKVDAPADEDAAEDEAQQPAQTPAAAPAAPAQPATPAAAPAQPADAYGAWFEQGERNGYINALAQFLATRVPQQPAPAQPAPAAAPQVRQIRNLRDIQPTAQPATTT